MAKNKNMIIKRLIPDTLTCCNLLCGGLAVYLATEQLYPVALLCILSGAMFDFMDGSSARLLKVSSPIGIELDSLADDITFGLAPSMMLMCYLMPCIGWWSLIALLMTAFSALRLAKFNLDTRQRSTFIGLATPPNAIFWSSLCCMPSTMLQTGWSAWVMLGGSLVSCYLLVSEIPFFGLKFRSLRWSDNKLQYLFLIGCVVIVVFSVLRAIEYGEWQLVTIAGAGCVVWYMMMNIVHVCSCKR